jgi:CRISPR-associated Csx2 family protein
MTTLISFLGKGREGGQYQTAKYQFENGAIVTEPYFGLALCQQLKPERLLLVGTAGSAWDIFFERESSTGDDALLALIGAVESTAVNDAVLAEPAKQLAARLGLQVDCLLIDYARTEAEQARVLRDLATRLAPREQVVMDITHTFRHLPMLALVAARYLARTQAIEVADIYYGALEMSEAGITPALRLTGMLHMLDWVDALSAYEKGGDYGGFAPLLRAEGLDGALANELEKAAFMERVTNSQGAWEHLRTSSKAIAAHDGAISGLFADQLQKRLAWTKGSSRCERELSLAKIWFERRDDLRAAIFLQEGLVTREVFANALADNDYEIRKEARIGLRENKQFRQLEELRNALAHGDRKPSAWLESVLKDEKKLQEFLQNLLKTLPQATRKP